MIRLILWKAYWVGNNCLFNTNSKENKLDKNPVAELYLNFLTQWKSLSIKIFFLALKLKMKPTKNAMRLNLDKIVAKG